MATDSSKPAGPHLDSLTVATAQFRPPTHRVAPGAIALWTVENLIGVAFAVAPVAAFAWLVDATEPGWLPDFAVEHAWWAPLLVLLLGAPAVLVAPTWRFAVHRWEVTADVVYTRSGWFDREWRLVPISRIQTVDTTRGLLERMLGLATLDIRTASHAGSSKVEGLPAGVAAAIAHDLARRAGALRDDAT